MVTFLFPPLAKAIFMASKFSLEGTCKSFSPPSAKTGHFTFSNASEGSYLIKYCIQGFTTCVICNFTKSSLLIPCGISVIGLSTKNLFKRLVKSSSSCSRLFDFLTTSNAFLFISLLRKGHKSGEVLVLLVFGNDRYGRKKEFAHSLMDICPSVVSVFYQVNNEKTSMILSSSPIKFLAGQRFIKSRLFDLTFRVGPSSFFQVNDGQTEVLYDMALYMAGLSGNEKVLDAYSGTGTIAMIAAKKACSVTAVESNEEAVAFAEKSADENSIGNVTFITDDASSFIKAEAKRKEHYDVVFLDPPRAGSDERFLSSLIKLSPGKII